jgi:hypothetical protein
MASKIEDHGILIVPNDGENNDEPLTDVLFKNINWSSTNLFATFTVTEMQFKDPKRVDTITFNPLRAREDNVDVCVLGFVFGFVNPPRTYGLIIYFGNRNDDGVLSFVVFLRSPQEIEADVHICVVNKDSSLHLEIGSVLRFVAVAHLLEKEDVTFLPKPPGYASSYVLHDVLTPEYKSKNHKIEGPRSIFSKESGFTGKNDLLLILEMKLRNKTQKRVFDIVKGTVWVKCLLLLQIKELQLFWCACG